MLEQITNGLFTGSIYALFAIGFTLVFGILRQLNLAHASIFTAGAFIAIGLIDGGTPAWLTFVLVAIAGVIVGLCLEFVAFRPLTGRPDEHFAGLISSVAFGGMVIALLRAYFGSEPRSIPADTLPATNWEFAGITVTFVQVLILTVSLVLMLALAWLVGRTTFGSAMRAVAENPDAARILGVNVKQVTASTYALSSALGATAGVLMAVNVGQANLEMGLSIELTGFAVIILGGLGSLWGAMTAGLVLGLAETFTVQYIDSSWKDVVAFGLLFAILLFRPQGLFGSMKTREV
ncbi:branched-chain amino acid ABC transporter permease [Haloglycomyces albus]|uniref:branched-chain amino acid ABC transporter permease n=1 Tax=Haloglycomyces albus TaxID=526067 RepID=UPI0004A4A642|nr:branched-chain amino acid ABC transporter permease [Haloglycomyces albus]